jgi:hypothetical protein
MSNLKARYWLLTIPANDYTVPAELPSPLVWLRGQKEIGNETNYEHWQLFASYSRQVRLGQLKKDFGQTVHAEPSRSQAAEAYVFKDDTAVEGSRFELGTKPLKRNSGNDWEAIRDCAKRGQLDDIPADVYVRNYSALKRIAVDHLQPSPIERTVYVFWGPTGTGKSRRAWEEATLDAYPKDPLSKFWDGYNGQEHVVIDEFRGVVSISHILRWFDRYPVMVEVKGSSTALKAKTIWITSNLHPNDWYPDLDAPTKEALLRRLTIIEIN